MLSGHQCISAKPHAAISNICCKGSERKFSSLSTEDGKHSSQQSYRKSQYYGVSLYNKHEGRGGENFRGNSKVVLPLMAASALACYLNTEEGKTSSKLEEATVVDQGIDKLQKIKALCGERNKQESCREGKGNFRNFFQDPFLF